MKYIKATTKSIVEVSRHLNTTYTITETLIKMEEETVKTIEGTYEVELQDVLDNMMERAQHDLMKLVYEQSPEEFDDATGELMQSASDLLTMRYHILNGGKEKLSDEDRDAIRERLSKMVDGFRVESRELNETIH